MSAHLAIARGTREYEGRTGPKAAFEFYLDHPTKASEDRIETILGAGNKKRQFEAYCGIFGDQFKVVKGAGAVRSEAQRQTVAEKLGRAGVGVQVFDQETDTEIDPSVAELASALGVDAEALAALVAKTGGGTVTKVAPKTERTIPVAKRISFKMAMALRKIATKKGVSFEITDKTGGEGTDVPADYTVVLDGITLSPVEASQVIEANKAKK